ncbi:HEAT repeat domain-containing protein [Thalassoroseus pseudoceratinae]|uniref:HEAT repeat domain-containing protein n=1 Tax=Thalassoroseus pseudoceratinae TaxID=2713176 RepID=UPI00141F946B|nr:HEAT repeat domain-containing protein [Thalassoroseus pseudoceratinae]
MPLLKFRFVWTIPIVAVVLIQPLELSAQQPADDAENDSPLLIEPETPEAAFDAARLMIRLGRPELSRTYLQQFLDSNPDDALLLKLREKFGPGVFLNLDNNKALRPESTQLLDRVNEVFRKNASDPKRVDRLIDDLSASSQKRAEATTALRNAGPNVVPRMIQRLAASQGDERDNLMITLVKMGPQAVPPLIGALSADNDDLRSAVIEVLGHIDSVLSIPHLWYPGFGKDQPAGVQSAARRALQRLLERPRLSDITDFEASNDLIQTARKHLRGEYPWPTYTEDDDITIWAWNPQQNTVTPIPMPPTAASLYEGSRLARDAVRLSPRNRDAQGLYLALVLGSEAYRNGPGQPLPNGRGTVSNTALAAGMDALNAALHEALDAGNAIAAEAIVPLLGQLSSRNDLATNVGASPLVNALYSPDRRVRFAAAETILGMDPKAPFEHSSRVVNILTQTLRDDGKKAALVIDPNESRAIDMAGRFAEIGFSGGPFTAATGQQGFRIAASRNDVELIVVNANVSRWPLSQLLANFRTDPRTELIPIVIYGPERVEPNVQYLLDHYSQVKFIVEPASTDFLELQVRPFLNATAGRPLTPDERSRYAGAATFWLADIADRRRTNVFPIESAESALSDAIEDPELARNAISALSSIGSESAQVRLQNVAVGANYPAETRKSAAWQLAFHIQRHGLLLRPAQIVEIKNALAAAKEPELIASLTTVMGSLRPDAVRSGQRLSNLTPPLPVLPE